jgi:hypothetical protein
MSKLTKDIVDHFKDHGTPHVGRGFLGIKLEANKTTVYTNGRCAVFVTPVTSSRHVHNTIDVITIRHCQGHGNGVIVLTQVLRLLERTAKEEGKGRKEVRGMLVNPHMDKLFKKCCEELKFTYSGPPKPGAEGYESYVIQWP